MVAEYQTTHLPSLLIALHLGTKSSRNDLMSKADADDPHEWVMHCEIRDKVAQVVDPRQVFKGR